MKFVLVIILYLQLSIAFSKENKLFWNGYDWNNITKLTNNDVNNMSERISEGLNIRFRDRLREYFNIFMDNIGFTLESGNSEINMNNKLTMEEYKENVIIHSRVSKKKALELGFENETECPICLDTLKFGLTWHQLKCGHMYHPKCLKQYLTKKCIRTECPTCRKDVRLN